VEELQRLYVAASGAEQRVHLVKYRTLHSVDQENRLMQVLRMLFSVLADV
jgi:hypothetical protein